MNRIINIISHPLFLSLVFTTVIILLLPPAFDKFNLDLIQSSTHEIDGDIYYDDLDGNGFSEQILFAANTKGKAMVYLRNIKGETMEQFNLEDEVVNFNPKCFYDYNSSGVKKIFVFTRRNDSLLLNCINPIGRETVITNRFITKVRKYKNTFDYSISISAACDLNNDNSKEILFAVNAGFALFPRRLFAYDIKNDLLMQSVELGNRVGELTLFDLNNDGINEIIAQTWAPGNYTDSTLKVEYSDTTGWVFVFDHNLDFFFPPIQFDYVFGTTHSVGIIDKGKPCIASIIQMYGESIFKSSLMIINVNGEVIRKKELPVIETVFKANYGQINVFDDKLMIFNANGECLFYDKKLNLVDRKQFPTKESINPSIRIMDINNDGENELLTSSMGNRKIFIADEDLKHLVTYNFGNGSTFEFSKIERGEDIPYLFLKSGREMRILEYYKNPLYFWHYPIYAGIFLLIVTLNILIDRIRKSQIKIKIETQQKLTELQLMTIRNQMEPHFTFNALNSIAAVVYSNNKEEAYNYFTKLSKLIRQTLESSDQVTRTLQEELDFVRNYIEIQKFRFPGKFEYNIELNKDIDMNLNVPKMVLQTYVENALKHGLANLDGNGKLDIILKKENEYLVVKIIDNGIGRKKAKEIGSRSSGKGVKIMQQYYELYNRHKKINIEYQIVDLTDNEGAASGTKVIIKIPINQS